MRNIACAVLLLASCAWAATITFDTSKYATCTVNSPCFLDNPSVWIGGVVPGEQDDVVVNLGSLSVPAGSVATVVLDTNSTMVVGSFIATSYIHTSPSNGQVALNIIFNAPFTVKRSFKLVGDGVNLSDGTLTTEDAYFTDGAQGLVRMGEFDATSLTVSNGSHFGTLNSTSIKISKIQVNSGSLFIYGSATIGQLDAVGRTSEILITGENSIQRVAVVGGRFQLNGGASTQSLSVEDARVYVTFTTAPEESSLSNCTGQYAPGVSTTGSLTTVYGGTLRIISPAQKATVAAYDGAVLIPGLSGSAPLNVDFDVYEGSTLKFSSAPVLGGSIVYRDSTGFWEISSPGPLVTGSLFLNNTVVVYQTEPSSRFSVVRCEHRTGEFSENVEWPDSHLYGTNWTATFRYTESNVYLSVSVSHQAPALPEYPPEEPNSPAAHHEPVAPVYQSALWISSIVGVGLSTIVIFIVVFSLKVCSKNSSEDEATTWLTSDLS